MTTEYRNYRDRVIDLITGAGSLMSRANEHAVWAETDDPYMSGDDGQGTDLEVLLSSGTYLVAAGAALMRLVHDEGAPDGFPQYGISTADTARDAVVRATRMLADVVAWAADTENVWDEITTNGVDLSEAEQALDDAQVSVDDAQQVLDDALDALSEATHELEKVQARDEDLQARASALRLDRPRLR